jgi:hypothetical protein
VLVKAFADGHSLHRLFSWLDWLDVDRLPFASSLFGGCTGTIRAEERAATAAGFRPDAGGEGLS